MFQHSILTHSALQELECLQGSGPNSHEEDDKACQDEHRIANVAVVVSKMLPQVIWDGDLLPVVLQVLVVLVRELTGDQPVDGVRHWVNPVVLWGHTQLSAAA